MFPGTRRLRMPHPIRITLKSTGMATRSRSGRRRGFNCNDAPVFPLLPYGLDGIPERAINNRFARDTQRKAIV